MVPLAAVSVLVALVALSVNVTGAGIGTREQQDTSTTVPLTAAGRELLEVLRQARSVTYRGRYTAKAVGLPDAAIQVETWRRPPRARQDTEIVQQGQVQRTRLLLLGGVTVQCVQAGEEAWACRELSTTQPGDSDPILGEVAEQVPNSRVSARNSVIRGEPARCFTLAGRDRSTEFCVSAGVPVRVSSTGVASRGVTLELAELGHDVPDDVFEPPAPPS